jgi:hypothetical protein
MMRKSWRLWSSVARMGRSFMEELDFWTRAETVGGKPL